MGADEALKRPEGRGGSAGRVIELLPSAVYRVELDSREQVLAHAAGAAVKNFVRLRPGDRVEVELSPHDRTRGRIIKILKERS